MKLRQVTGFAGFMCRLRDAVDRFWSFCRGRRFYISCPRGNRGVTAGVRRLEVSEVKKDAVLFFDCSLCCRFHDGCNGPRVERLRG